MYVEDNQMPEAQKTKFIEIANHWWKESDEGNLQMIGAPYAVRRDGRWFAVVTLRQQPLEQQSEPLD